MRYIRVFVSSPGDCSAHRDVLGEVVVRINASEADRSGIHLRLFNWEDAVVPRIGPPPQAVVDEQTPLCDIYMGIMSARFGGDGTRESGTEHEFRQALERFGATASPWVLFYFDDTPPTPKSVAESRQWTRVLEFREELEKRGIVGSFSGVRGSENGFFERVELHLRRLLQRQEFTLTGGVDAARGAATEKSAGSATTDTSKPPIPVDYVTWLQSKCAAVDLFGLEPKFGVASTLHSVYVPLTTMRRAGDDAETGDVHADAKGRKRKKGSREKEAGRLDASEREAPTLLLDRLGRESLYVSGAPGSGKSTFCRWVVWLAAEGRIPTARIEPPEGYAEQWPAGLGQRLPVLVRLRDAWLELSAHHGARDLSRVNLEAALARWVEANTESLPADIFRAHLGQGSALLVLDGVDEVPVAVGEGSEKWSPRALLVSGLANACQVWSKTGNRVLVTSRPYGLSRADEAALGIASAPVNDLDEPLQQLLVHRWFRQLRPGGEGETFATGLLSHLRDYPGLAPLAVNPLLLTAMCIVYDEGGRLPQDKHDLYTRVVNTVLNSRHYRDDVVAREDARYRLQAVAHAMHTGEPFGEKRVTPAAEATLQEVDAVLANYMERNRAKHDGAIAVVRAREELLSQSGLFLGTGESKAAFLHLSFQEFLAGQRIADLEDDVCPTFEQRAETAEWHNTLSLLFAGLTQEKAKRLLSKLARSIDRTDVTRGTGLQLVVADCLDILRARNVWPDDETVGICRDAFGRTLTSTAPAAVRCKVGETLGRIGDPRFHGDELFCLPNDPMLGFVEVPSRESVMGSQDGEGSDDERPQHRLTVPTFYVACYPTTVAQFAAFVRAAGYAPTVEDWMKGAPTCPVTNVSWHDALAYCRWLTAALRALNGTSSEVPKLLAESASRWAVTLPSEAEWERVARGSIGRTYPWGEGIDADRANYRDAGLRRASPVGMFPRGMTPLEEGAVADLSGNVWEWTRSHYKPYPYRQDDGREDLAAGEDVPRVVRGGSFDDYEGLGRAAYRGGSFPGNPNNLIGFRVVVSCLRS